MGIAHTTDRVELPHPANRLPVIGDVLGAPSDRLVQSAMDDARALGPIFTRKFFDTEVVFVSGADLVAELADEDRFAKHVGNSLVTIRGLTGDGLFTAFNDEPNWAKAHDILLPAFAMSSMRTYHPTMLTVARKLINSWDQHAGKSTVDISGDMTKLTLDTIGLAGFGYDFGSFESEATHPFITALVRGLAFAQAKNRHIPGLDFLYRKGNEQFAADVAFLNGVVDEVIKERIASGDTSTDDLLGLMLNAPHPKSGETLDEVNIRNQVVTFLIAGHETTSGTLSFALHFLTKNPAVLARAQAEVDALWGDVEDPDPSFEDIGKLRYVRQILNETLRLWPTAAIFARQALRDTEIGGKYPVAKGEAMLVLTPMLHRDPVWGDNVESFDPERFSPERERDRPVHAFKPFGTGERACIGRQFALHEATLLLGLLIHRFRFLDQDNYQLKVKETLTLKPEGLHLGLARRTSADRRQPAVVETAHATAKTAGRMRQGTKLTVLHGSNLGTCRTLAKEIAEAGEQRGCDVSVDPLDVATRSLPTGSPVVIVAASYNGRPTDDATEFWNWLNEAEPGSLDGVRYALLGVGDRNWAATYLHVPTALDARLTELGATRLLDRGEADASGDLAGAVTDWSEQLWTALLAEYGDPDAVSTVDISEGPRYAVRTLSGPVTAARDARHEVLPMTVLDTADLAELDHPLGRSKRFLRIALPEGVTYRTADHLTVLPANDPAQVERAARLLRLDLDDVLEIADRRPGRGALGIDRPVTARALLTHFVELQDPATPAQLTTLAANNPCPPERTALEALAAQPDGRSVLDLLEVNPACRLTLDVALELLPPLRPRHYSISSSAASQPGAVDLMVSLLAAPSRCADGTFRGIGSAYLTGLRPGDTVLAKVQPCREAFRLDPAADRPVIMISAGTGLAPFRGAIADRLAVGNTGPALCYFGCDHPEVDYLHRAELEAAEQAGVVSMRPAFSQAPVADVQFVQHRIAAEGEQVWQLLDSGAAVYVCGDGARMAPGVRAAFLDLHRKHTGGDQNAAEAWLADLIARDRYIEDVYSG
ncbi:MULTISPECIES: bifunctional cytochrome P450/NADPH--P450 reductase [unclassified Crossiella]|uniref:bifunctional cytochrome P450/NADPH--P450 reductase n=1 Tax=unclassified Crossiella TaxID=2620835 RepID=UPI001FFF92C1|nr:MULTISPECIES: cytochrome P450 [unclassified Crossiella]MCK2242894.1 cytochrome P450 [Crossiella sp. S99.2]MCK2256771.1 cytochrome P450 [Crossiella sp. S99.1]